MSWCGETSTMYEMKRQGAERCIIGRLTCQRGRGQRHAYFQRSLETTGAHLLEDGWEVEGLESRGNLFMKMCIVLFCNYVIGLPIPKKKGCKKSKLSFPIPQMRALEK